jgi:hypothetical protein
MGKDLVRALVSAAHRLRMEAFYLLFGLSIGSGGLVLSQVCPSTGQCGSCGACLAGLPLLALVAYAIRKRRSVQLP